MLVLYNVILEGGISKSEQSCMVTWCVKSVKKSSQPVADVIDSIINGLFLISY